MTSTFSHHSKTNKNRYISTSLHLLSHIYKKQSINNHLTPIINFIRHQNPTSSITNPPVGVGRHLAQCSQHACWNKTPQNASTGTHRPAPDPLPPDLWSPSCPGTPAMSFRPRCGCPSPAAPWHWWSRGWTREAPPPRRARTHAWWSATGRCLKGRMRVMVKEEERKS